MFTSSINIETTVIFNNSYLKYKLPIKYLSEIVYVIKNYNYSQIREADWCWTTKYTRNFDLSIPSEVNGSISFHISGFLDDTVRIYQNNSLVGDIWVGGNKSDGRTPGNLNSTVTYNLNQDNNFSVRLINSGANYMATNVNVYYSYYWITK